MNEWQTEINKGLWVGIGIILLVLLIDAGLILLATSRPVSLGTFAIGLSVLTSFGLMGLVGYWLYGLMDSEYFLDRNVLIIHWGPTEQVIPMGQVERVVLGEEVEGRIHFYGGMWPGHFVGYGDIPEVGSTLFYATVPPRQQVYVVTSVMAYGISPVDREAFLESLHKRLEMGPTQVVDQSSQRPAFLSWPIWQDRLALVLFGGGIFALLALIGFLSFRFPALPPLVPLHFDASGTPDRLGARANIFIVPLIGLLAVVINDVLGWLLHERERMASYLLWGGAFLVQIFVWTAIIGILTHT
jgi:hypothetical protein